MGTIKLDYQMDSVQGKHKHLTLSLSEFQKFNTLALGLGDISKEGEQVDALVTIFDLEHFSAFCNQIDPHLVLPDYLDQFFKWLFSEISATFTKEYRSDCVVLWGKFPFFAKFLGDGILMMWNTKGLGQASLGNIVINLYKVRAAYSREFIPRIVKDYSRVPPRLRCGIARGEVISIGGGKDFVGSCINVAARLQKISKLSFAFPRKGFDPQACFSHAWQKEFLQKRIDVRGIEKQELIFVCRKEFDELPDEEKQLFRDS